MPKPTDNPQFRATDSFGRDVSAAAAAAPARAMQGMGGAMTKVGEEIDSRLMKLADEHNKAKLMEDEGIIASRQQDFWNWTLTHQDTDTWKERYNAVMQGVSGELASKQGSPEYRKARGQLLQRMTTSGTIKMQGQAASLKTQQIKQMYRDTLERQKVVGDFDGRRRTHEEMRSSGLFPPSEIDTLEVIAGKERLQDEIWSLPAEERRKKIGELRKGIPNMGPQYEQNELANRLESQISRNIRGQLEQLNSADEASRMTEEEYRQKLDGIEDLTEDEKTNIAKRRGDALADDGTPLPVARRMYYREKLRKLREHRESDNYNERRYQTIRDQIGIEMNADFVQKRHPDLYGEWAATSVQRMDSAVDDLQRRAEADTAAAKKEANTDTYNRRVEPLLTDALGDDESIVNLIKEFHPPPETWKQSPEEWASVKVKRLRENFQNDAMKWLESAEIPVARDRAMLKINGWVQEWLHQNLGEGFEENKQALFNQRFEEWMRSEPATKAMEDVNSPLPVEGALSGEVVRGNLLPDRNKDGGEYDLNFLQDGGVRPKR